ncbi:MAG: hypothetical protein HY290_16625, partial [Planctomycetia bacterium]|nr:hypothetical protein [Planctomycetia bacterium]
MPGVLGFNLILSQETENQFQIAMLTTVGRAINLDTTIEFTRRTGQARFVRTEATPANDPLAIVNLHRDAHDRLRPRADAVYRENELISEFNRRVILVLVNVSGQEATDRPQDWWSWWASYSDVESSAPKPTSIVSEDDYYYLPVTTTTQYVINASCFAAGTPVWTESGLRPIESVAIGDRVLAKNVETGELGYKPVLQSTIRPPRATVQFRAADETITCTGGHRFWVSGTGWVKARDLKTQSLLHTATGTAPVWSARPDEPAK